jgi:hypothetical protein
MPKIQEAILEWFSKHSNRYASPLSSCICFCDCAGCRTLLDKTLNGDESMCFGATM